jgi:hypothetical protein
VAQYFPRRYNGAHLKKHVLKHPPMPQPVGGINDGQFRADESTNTHPREPMELQLILLSKLPVHRSESRLLSREFLVEVADVAGRFLYAKVKAKMF